MKLDLLVFAAHPDDAELSCSGTLLTQIALGKKAGIIDLTEGELGTRGTVETRREEARCSSEILGLSVRENLGLPDGFFENDKTTQLTLIRVLRKYRPDIVLINAREDRHPDHGRGGTLQSRACFLSGLAKIDTGQAAWRPRLVFHYIQDRYLKPDFVVDITAQWEKKKAAIQAFKTQFFDPQSKEPLTYISHPDFLDFVEARAREMGHHIGVKYGEGFQTDRVLGVRDLSGLL